MSDLAIETLLTEAGCRSAEAGALIENDRQVSYGDLERSALGMCLELRRAHVGLGERVAIIAPNSSGFVAAFFGALMAGASAVTLSPESTGRELRGMIEVARPGAAVLIRNSGGRNYEADLADALPTTRLWIDSDGRPTWRSSDDRRGIIRRPPDDPALLAFTSGSTGRPKAALHRAATLTHAARLYVESVLSGNSATHLAALPLCHLGGIVLTLLPAVMTGGLVVLAGRFTSRGALEAVARHRVQVFMAIPAMVELIFVREQPEAWDLRSLQKVVLGGAPVSNQLVRRIANRLSAQVQVGYGSTECPGFWCITRDDTPIEEIGPFVGWPAPSYEVSIRNGTKDHPAVGEPGEICVRSQFSMTGYVGAPEATAAAIDAEGWLHTGDLGMLRADGGLVVVGRSKDMYIRGGFNVYPREVEEALLEHPRVSAAAVHGVPDPVLGERGCAWIVPTRGKLLDQEEIREFLTGLLSRHKRPDFIRIVESLPMNAVGKVDKTALVAALERERRPRISAVHTSHGEADA